MDLIRANLGQDQKDCLAMINTLQDRLHFSNPDELEAAMHQLIPISRHLGVSLVSYAGDSLTVSAPFDKNYNHQLSAFGGSLFAVAVLAGWGLVQLKLSERQLDCNTVISKAEASYLKPIYEDLRCTALLPEGSDRLLDQLAEDGRARMHIVSRYGMADETAMSVEGTYHLALRS